MILAWASGPNPLAVSAISIRIFPQAREASAGLCRSRRSELRFLKASTAGLKHLLAGQIIAAFLLLLLRVEQTVKVDVQAYGRATPVDLALKQIELVPENSN
jgi:hypothetical protein